MIVFEKEIFKIIEKAIEEQNLSLFGEMVIKWENGKVVICKETKSIKP